MSVNNDYVPVASPSDVVRPYILDEESGVFTPASTGTLSTLEVKSEVDLITDNISEDTDEFVEPDKTNDESASTTEATITDTTLEVTASASGTTTKRSRRKPQQPRRLDSNRGSAFDEEPLKDSDDDGDETVQRDRPTKQAKVKLKASTQSTVKIVKDKVPCRVCGRMFANRYMASHMKTHKATPASRRSPRRSTRQELSRYIPYDEGEEDDDEEEEVAEDVGTNSTTVTPRKQRRVSARSSSTPKVKLYVCYVCDRSFSKSSMPAHMRTHQASKAKKFKAENVDNDDEQMDEDDDENQESPGDAVSDRKTTRRKLKKFPCDICGKSFDRYYLLEHMRSHARRMSEALAKTSKKNVKTVKKSTVKKKDVDLDLADDKPPGSIVDDNSPGDNENVDGDNNNGDDDDHDEEEEVGSDENSAVEEDDGDEDEEENGKKKKKSKKLAKTEGREKKSRRRQRPKFPCDICGTLFNKYYMIIHMRSHTGEKPFTCPQCDKQFVSANSLTAHNTNCHGEERGKVQCDICGRLVSSKMSLKQHLRTHSDEKPYQCHVCGKSFKQCAQLSAHVKTHSDGMPYQCEDCGHRYKSVTGLIRHREYHHLGIRKKYPCEICGKSFTRHSKLRDHLMWHRGTSPYVCKYCGKRLLSRKTLNSHLLIHEDLKPYKCNECGKSFRQNCVLKRHLTVHTGIKPFRCDLCGKQFIHRVYLVKHSCDVHHLEGDRTFLAL